MKSKKSTFKSAKRHKILFSIILLILLSFCAFLIPRPLNPPFNINCTSILIPKDSIKFTTEEIKNHNLVLINVLEDRLNLLKSLVSSFDNIRWQTRAVYFGIFAIIVMTLSLKKQSKKKFLCRILLFIIVLMYLLDVHLEDLYNRQNIGPQVIGRTVEELVNFNYKKPSAQNLTYFTKEQKGNFKLNDNTWYDYNPDALNDSINRMSEGNIRIIRKIKLACKWDLVRFTYFIVPCLILFFIGIFNLKKPLLDK
jgi:hypothetical protein